MSSIWSDELQKQIDKTLKMGEEIKRRNNMRCVDEFHNHYENNKMWKNTNWFGLPMWKLPFDAMIIQEIIYGTMPDYIIETGTGHGGSALFYAGICELLGQGEVITIDIENEFNMDYVSQHQWSDRIEFINGSSTNQIVFNKVKEKTEGKRNLVILDSWHSYEHVCKELDLYEQLVPIDSYIIVEDTHVSGHPVEWPHGKGPYEAVEWFLSIGNDFEPQYWCEKYIMTFNPKGYLKRIK